MMKKIKCLQILLAGILLAVPSVTSAASTEQEWVDQSFGNCTTLMAHGKAAQGGGLILAKNRDQSYMTPSTVMVQPHKKHAAGSSVQTVTITIPQVEETYAFTGSGSAGAFGVAFGINEKKVAVASNDTNSRDELTYEQGLSDNDLVRLILERASTAKEGLELAIKLTETYGQGYHGEVYEIGDADGIWILETTGKRWAAKHYTDTVLARANQFELTDGYDLCSADLVSFAQKMGWAQEVKPNGRINFRQTYGGDKLNPLKEEPLNKRVASATLYESNKRHARCEELLLAALHKQNYVTVSDMMGFLRDHYDTYQLPSGKIVDLKQVPFYASEYGATHEREAVYTKPQTDTQAVPLYVQSICAHGIQTNATTSAAVMVVQEQKPALMLCSIGTPCSGIFVPFFPAQTKVEEHYAGTGLTHTAIAINLLSIGSYPRMAPIVQNLLRPAEKEALNEVQGLSEGTSPAYLTALSQKWAAKAYKLTTEAHTRLQKRLEEVFAHRHS
jgi:dipeptidase